VKLAAVWRRGIVHGEDRDRVVIETSQRQDPKGCVSSEHTVFRLDRGRAVAVPFRGWSETESSV